MISELRISDLGVIDDARLDLHPGLTVVTGETGAGKTMVVTGLGLLLGGRSDPGAVRSGATRARVEGRFVCSQESLVERVAGVGGDLDGDELLIAPHVTAMGRSRCYVGGTQLPASVCAEIAADLVTIHGQSEHVQLAQSDRQRDIVDRYAGADLVNVLMGYTERYLQRKAVVAELGVLRNEAQSRAREIDLLRFGLDEIEKVAPMSGEDVSLAAEAERLQSSDDLRLAAQQAIVALAGDDQDTATVGPGASVLSCLGEARKALEQLSGRDPAAADLGGRAAEASYLLTDLASDVTRYLADLDVEPGRLEVIAERRSALSALMRKYGDSCSEVLTWGQEAACRLVALENSDERIGRLTDQLSRLDLELAGLADALTKKRTEAARKLSAKVITELAALALPHARLLFEITTLDEPGPYGRDRIELLFSANPGSRPRPLSRVASGGELSRIRLSLEVVLAAGTEAKTLVFDEVDAGVGGKVAVEIGRRLALLSRHAQVIVVTHLAQVAAFADRHFVVVKADDGQVTTSGIAEVRDDQRAAELARMMAGLETTDSALAHAEQLIATAGAYRT